MNMKFSFRTIESDEIIVVSVVRNEFLRLPWFLNYHRKLGFDKFIIIDNGSTDETATYLKNQPDVNIATTFDSYSKSKCGITWTNKILHDFCKDHWVLIVDADELFVYPYSETINVHILTSYLDQKGDQAVVAPLLDLYSKGPIKDTGYIQGAPFHTYCQYFDSDSYQTQEVPGIVFQAISRGGPRHRLFWENNQLDYPSPYLFKIPFIKWRSDLDLEASTHILNGAKIATLTGVLLHFKFLQDFKDNAELEALRKEHYCNASQYKAYVEGILQDENLSAYYSGSKFYEGSHQLIREKIINKPLDFP